MTTQRPTPAATAALARLGFSEPRAVRADLEALGAWPPGDAGADGLLRELAGSANPELATRALAAVAAAHPDRPALLAALHRRPGFRHRLVALLAASRSLGAWLAAHPQEADRLGDEDATAAARGVGELVAEARAVVGRQAQPAAAWDALRRFRRRELARVAVRDLAGDLPVDQVGAELADLAQACLQAALAVAEREVGEPARLAVLGMGKLGGGELNYVSDVDVLFCHAPLEGQPPEQAAAVAQRVARALLAGLGAVTPEGAGLRVDANLRPEGRNGPLSRTLASYRAYWQRWAQAWEVQALVKVRPVAGDPGLAAAFCRAAAERVYPARLDPDTITAIRKMKARIEAERLPAGSDPRLHTKLGPGGLVDVEFAVQLLQLRLGHDRPAVRVPGTLAAIDALRAAGALQPGEAAWLADAYRLCQRVRNRAYLVAGRPADALPGDPRGLERLARALGEPSRQRLLEAYQRATRRAHRVVLERFWDGSG